MIRACRDIKIMGEARTAEHSDAAIGLSLSLSLVAHFKLIQCANPKVTGFLPASYAAHRIPTLSPTNPPGLAPPNMKRPQRGDKPCEKGRGESSLTANGNPASNFRGNHSPVVRNKVLRCKPLNFWEGAGQFAGRPKGDARSESAQCLVQPHRENMGKCSQRNSGPSPFQSEVGITLLQILHKIQT